MINSYALVDDKGNVLSVILCEPSKIREHTINFGADAYIKRPDENVSGFLRMMEPGAVLSGFVRNGRKISNPGEITFRGSLKSITALECPPDLPEEV